MAGYASNIISAAALFPLLALVITLPYMIYQYRRFGSIPWLRTFVVYSFVFYLLCAYFMVLLPLPSDRTAVVAYAQTPQLLPFNFVRAFLAETGFSPTDPSTWLATLTDPYVYEAFFNVLLLVPLGMYLRYYFRRSWWQTLLIGFAVTLSFELTQLTGLWGLYEHPYRLFDVDDLMMNSLGAMAGYWMAGPAMRLLPDIRLVNEEAREAGVRAGVTKRALSFGIDLAAAAALAVLAGLGARAALGGEASAAGDELRPWIDRAAFLACFVVIPALSGGQTLGQRALRLRIVRADASQARWYHYLARYGLLYLFVMAPWAALHGVMGADLSAGAAQGGVARFLAAHQGELVAAWLSFMALWTVSLLVRAARAAALKRPFVMLNGLLSNTRVMTLAGVQRERERRNVLDVAEVGALEQAIARAGTSLAELMERAGAAAARAVRLHVPDPAPVVILSGSGNNGGDGWVCARLLAEAGYPVTLIAPDLAERLKTEPARTKALDAFSDAAARRLPLHVFIAPDADVLDKAIEGAHAVVDAMLGTGFNGEEVRAPYGAWIEAANRRRFGGRRGKGRGFHRKRSRQGPGHGRSLRRRLPRRAKDAPFALAIDVPSGLSAQTGRAGAPCFSADMTVTMIAFKPGLVQGATDPWTGQVVLAHLLDVRPYLASLREGTHESKDPEG